MKKFFAVFMAVIVLAGATLGGLQLWAPDKYKPSEWVKQLQTDKTPDEGDKKPDDGNGDGTEEDYSVSGIKASCVSDDDVTAQAVRNGVAVTYANTENASSCTINVTVLTSSGTSPTVIQRVTWSLSDANAGLTMTVDGTSATFTCGENGFTRQVTATCTSVLNKDVSKTFTFDCAYRYYDYVAFKVNDSDTFKNITVTTYDNDPSMYRLYRVPSNLEFNYWLSKFVADKTSGTVRNELQSAKFTVTPTERLANSFIAAGVCSEVKSYFWMSNSSGQGTGAIYNHTGTDGISEINGGANVNWKTDSSFRMSITGNSGDGQWTSKFYECIENNSADSGAYSDGDFVVEITTNWKYGGEKKYRYYVDFYSLASDMTSDSDDNIIL